MSNLFVFRFDRLMAVKIALCVLFFFSTGNFAEQIIPESISYIHQLVVLTIAWAIIGMVCFGFLKLPAMSLQHGPIIILYVGFIGLVMLSLFWSNLDGGVLARAFAFMTTTTLAYILASQIKVQTYFRLLFKVQLLLLVISLLFVLLLPGIGIDSGAHEGAWRGIFSQKNSFGRAVAFLGLLGMLLYFSGERLLSFNKLLVLYIVCCFVLLASDSKTSLIMLSIFPFILLGLKFGERFLSSRPAGLMLLSFIVLLMLYLFNTDAVYLGNVSSANDYIYLFGFEVPLTGRATLWSYVHHSIYSYEKYWLGFGYDGFWGHDFAVMYRWGLGEFEANDSHNGFLDTFLQLGIFGLITLYLCLSLFFLKALFLATRQRAEERSYGRMLLIFLIFMCLFNLTESTFLKSTNIMQFTLSFLFFSLAFRQKTTATSD